MSRLMPISFVLLLLALSARSAAPPVPEFEKWTIDDVVDQESVSDVAFSPDGRFVVWVKHTTEKEENAHVGQLFRTEVATGKQVQLTRSKEECSHPAWSPDGEHIAFLSERPVPAKSEAKTKSSPRGSRRAKKDEVPKSQIWLLDPTGGEAWHLTESQREITAYGWAGADTIIFAAQEDPTRRETVLNDEKKDETTVVEDEKHEPPVRLFKVDVKSKKVTRISDNTDRIEQLSVSPDGKNVVALHGRSLRYIYDNKVKPIAMLHDPETSKSRRIFADDKLNIASLQWERSGAGIYITSDRSSRPELNQAGVTEVHFFDTASNKISKVELNWPRGLAPQSGNGAATGLVPLNDGFFAFLADGVHLRVARITRTGAKWSKANVGGKHEGQLFGLASTADGTRIAYARSTASTPTQWYHAALTGTKLGEPAQLIELNDSLKKRLIARTEVVRWKGARGEEVEGILYYPHERKKSPAPLVVQIHGGPASADLNAWEEDWAYSANLLCQRGAFVLRPNYHGSTNYGPEWLESIAHGKYCEPELEDIEKGVDALIAKGLVDPKHLGLQGWSNGAILTNQLIAKTSRYRAAVAGAGTVEYVSDWATCEFGEAFDRFYLGKSPLEDPQLYFRKSPFHNADKIRTPTLIFFGTEDRVVHPQQGWAQYRALQQLGKTPVRFVLFPGEKHSLKKVSHQKRKLEEEMAWFDRHLFGTEEVKNQSLKDESPLAWLLRKQAAKRDGERYGEKIKGVLVPETVKYEGMHIGRFEVTRAQFAAFDKTYHVETGKENFPANNITHAQAKAYCVWLSKLTGQTYRLPNDTEAEKLYESSEAGENTLDAWAGYTPNLDDAKALREQLKKLKGDALLREVGKGRGSGKDELVYDLGGNVAEWTEHDGEGETKGGSADVPVDSRGGIEALPAYRGLRVVRE